MEINDKLFLKYKYDYLELSLKISKLRYDGEEVPIDLLLQALQAGCLSDIPDDELKIFYSTWIFSNRCWCMLKFLVTVLTFLLFFVAYASSGPFWI